MRKQTGFSLIEIMVVVVIIGLLATAVLPNVMGNLAKANTERVVSDFQAISTALKMYKLDNFVYPTTDQGLEALVAPPASDPQPRNWRQGGYLDKLPLDPWDNPYLYESPADLKPFVIYTLGADGVRGGVDEYADISNWDDAVVQ